MARALLLVPFLCTSAWLQGQAGEPPAATLPRTGFLDETITVAGTEHRYVVYVPHDYTKDRSWPLIVFLNGAGECGTDGKKQISVGLAPAIRNDPAAWPFVVVFPQKPNRASAWEDHDPMVMAMLARCEKDYAIDEKQRFLTGLSQGGHGTWVLGARHADVWAAIAPVCGYGDPIAIARQLKSTPIWCFHGDDDKAVPVQQSKDLCAAVEEAGGHAELTLYPGVGHNSWDNAYGEEPLAEWLLTAASDTVYASLLKQLQSSLVTIELGNEWQADAAGKEKQHARGTTTTKIVLGEKGLSWSIATTHHDGTTDAPRQGSIAAQDARRFCRDRLRELQRGGVFQLTGKITAAAAATRPATSNAYTIGVSCAGKDAPETAKWAFRRELPAEAEHDPQFAPQVRALVAFAAMIAAMR